MKNTKCLIPLKYLDPLSILFTEMDYFYYYYNGTNYIYK